jgi:hypothetical protein
MAHTLEGRDGFAPARVTRSAWRPTRSFHEGVRRACRTAADRDLLPRTSSVVLAPKVRRNWQRGRRGKGRRSSALPLLFKSVKNHFFDKRAVPSCGPLQPLRRPVQNAGTRSQRRRKLTSTSSYASSLVWTSYRSSSQRLGVVAWGSSSRDSDRDSTGIHTGPGVLVEWKQTRRMRRCTSESGLPERGRQLCRSDLQSRISRDSESRL